MTRYFSTLAIALAAALFSAAAPAETIIHYKEGQRVDPTEVARVLGGVKTRAIRLLDEPAPTAAAAAPAAAAIVATVAAPATVAAKQQPQEPAPSEASGLSLPVRFAFGSAEIMPAARAQIDQLAAGIKLLSPERVITIEGHTDAAGSDAYNLELSRERARSVRDYLVQQHGIDGSHLKTAGYGESRPIEGSDPYAGQNRRVEFHGS